MAEPLDVDARLAEGRPAVDTVGEYVWACHLLGYQNPDLTLHAAQVRDWYGSEDGLDLHALEADRAALAAAAAATDNARQLQDKQLDVLAAAWQGRGGGASHDFLRRHGEASAAAASATRNAVDALAALRDDLWQAVDGKVGAAVAIDDRHETQRAQWLAATQTVTTGAGDRAVASELIDQQVKPFVDNDIRSDWLTAMHKAMAAVAAAFDAATSLLTDGAQPTFEVPADLGPSSMAPPPSGAAPAEAAGTAPAAWVNPAIGSAPAAAPALGPMAAPAPAYPAAPEPLTAATTPAPLPATAPAPTAPAMPSMPSLGEASGGLPGGSGGLAGLGTQLADAIGGLLDRPGAAPPDLPEITEDPVDKEAGLHDGEPDEERAEEHKPEDDEEADDETGPETAEPTDEDAAVDNPVDTCAEEQEVNEAPAADPAPAPPPAPMSSPQPIVEPPPNAEPLGAETPCEIAADELPQAGP